MALSPMLADNTRHDGDVADGLDAMTAANFQPCLAFTLGQEGGWYADPAGGPTEKGITLKTFRHYFPRGTVAQLQAITAAQVSLIYESGYWREVYGDELPAGLDLMVFDNGVNIGPGTAVAQLQVLLDVDDDWIVGPETLKAIAAQSLVGLIANLAGRQRAYYRSLDNPADIDGWLARLERRTKAALAMTGTQTPKGNV
jgi:lysozyme family protein